VSESPLSPDKSGTGLEAPADESAAATRQMEHRAHRARIRREDAEAESLRTQSRNLRKQTDADSADRDEWTKANIEDQRKRTDADIADRLEWTRAKIAERQRRTEVETSGLGQHDKTTNVERYFWMGMVALGVLATIVLACITAGQSVWEYRISPVAGLLLSGGGGFQLWAISKRQPSGDAEEAETGCAPLTGPGGPVREGS
jgi:hypothetical protein